MSAAQFELLREVTTATITTMLLKKGIRRCWMNGPKPLAPTGKRIAGPAFTLRFVPAREDLATPEAFAKDPKLVWEWYNWRRELIATKSQNPAHFALAELERRARHSMWLITQNVDGLHRAAGSHRLSEIHGNIWMVRCTQCGFVTEDRRVPIPILPACETCGALIRPHIVWFGESLDPAEIQRCTEALQSCDVLLVIGTSGVVYPAAGFASVAKQAGATVVEINLDDTPQSNLVDLALRGRAKDLVPQLL